MSQPFASGAKVLELQEPKFKSWNQMCNLSCKTVGFGQVLALATWIQASNWVTCF